MAAGKVRSAKKRRFIHNTIVHVVLAILALIWVFPILWVILTSFRAEKDEKDSNRMEGILFGSEI